MRPMHLWFPTPSSLVSLYSPQRWLNTRKRMRGTGAAGVDGKGKNKTNKKRTKNNFLKKFWKIRWQAPGVGRPWDPEDSLSSLPLHYVVLWRSAQGSSGGSPWWVDGGWLAYVITHPKVRWYLRTASRYWVRSDCNRQTIYIRKRNTRVMARSLANL